MAFPLLAAGAVLGGLGSLLGARSQKKASNAQADIAKKQAALFNQTQPIYQEALQGLRQNAGLGVANSPNLPNIYGNVTNQQLGPYGMNPTDRLRLLGAEENINKGLQSRQNQLGFQLGHRGLTDSNIGIAAQAQLLNQANQQRGTFARNLAINAPQEQQQRLAALLNALNPGLGSGPAASSAYGQIGANAGNAAAGIAGNLGGAAQNYAYMNALKGQSGDEGNAIYGGSGLPTELPTANFTAPGLGYGNPEGFTPNPNYGAPTLGIGMGNYPGAPQNPFPNHQPFSEFGQP